MTKELTEKAKLALDRPFALDSRWCHCAWGASFPELASSSEREAVLYSYAAASSKALALFCLPWRGGCVRAWKRWSVPSRMAWPFLLYLGAGRRGPSGAEAPLAPPRPSVASACRAGLVCCVARLAEASVHEAGARRGAAGS